MAKKTEKKERFYCHSCGCELTNDNCRQANNSVTGYSHLCVDCEQTTVFDRIANRNGRNIGLFYTCIALDCPCTITILKDCLEEYNKTNSPWLLYLNKLQEHGADRKGDKLLGFADGACKTLKSIFGDNLSHKDFVGYLENEEKRLSKGTELQRERWGVMPLVKGLAWTQELYDELDRIYDTRVSAFKGQDLNLQQISTLIRVSKKEVIADWYTRQGNIKGATDTEKSISQLLADENMRPKDKKPVEELRLDALVLALEDAGLMENGDLLTYDELIEVMRDRFVKSPKYNYSLDVADQMILDVINSMRQNADLPTIQDLPEEFAPVDEYGEFTPEETEREKENKKYLGITKVNIVKSDKGDK